MIDADDADVRTTARALHAALATVVAASATPYGYTVTVWSSGAVLIHSHGLPRVGEVFAFIAGAVAGFSLMSVLARGPVGRMESVEGTRERVLAGTFNWLAVGAAVGAVALLAQLHGWAMWPLGSFVATSVYILGSSFALGVASLTSNRPHTG